MDPNREKLLNYQHWDSWISDWVHNDCSDTLNVKSQRKSTPTTVLAPVGNRKEDEVFSKPEKETKNHCPQTPIKSSINELVEPKKKLKKKRRQRCKRRHSLALTKPLRKQSSLKCRPLDNKNNPKEFKRKPLIGRSKFFPSGHLSAELKKVFPNSKNIRPLTYKAKKIGQTSSKGLERKTVNTRHNRYPLSLSKMDPKPQDSKLFKQETDSVSGRLDYKVRNSRFVCPSSAVLCNKKRCLNSELVNVNDPFEQYNSGTPFSNTSRCSSLHKPTTNHLLHSSHKRCFPRAKVKPLTSPLVKDKPIKDTWSELKRLKAAHDLKVLPVLKQISDDLSVSMEKQKSINLDAYDNASNAMEQMVFKQNTHAANLQWERDDPDKKKLKPRCSNSSPKTKLRSLRCRWNRLMLNRNFNNLSFSSTESGPFMRLSELRSTSSAEAVDVQQAKLSQTKISAVVNSTQQTISEKYPLSKNMEGQFSLKKKSASTDVSEVVTGSSIPVTPDFEITNAAGEMLDRLETTNIVENSHTTYDTEMNERTNIESTDGKIIKIKINSKKRIIVNPSGERKSPKAKGKKKKRKRDKKSKSKSKTKAKIHGKKSKKSKKKAQKKSKKKCEMKKSKKKTKVTHPNQKRKIKKKLKHKKSNKQTKNALKRKIKKKSKHKTNKKHTKLHQSMYTKMHSNNHALSTKINGDDFFNGNNLSSCLNPDRILLFEILEFYQGLKSPETLSINEIATTSAFESVKLCSANMKQRLSPLSIVSIKLGPRIGRSSAQSVLRRKMKGKPKSSNHQGMNCSKHTIELTKSPTRFKERLQMRKTLKVLQEKQKKKIKKINAVNVQKIKNSTNLNSMDTEQNRSFLAREKNANNARVTSLLLKALGMKYLNGIVDKIKLSQLSSIEKKKALKFKKKLTAKKKNEKEKKKMKVEKMEQKAARARLAMDAYLLKNCGKLDVKTWTVGRTMKNNANRTEKASFFKVRELPLFMLIIPSVIDEFVHPFRVSVSMHRVLTRAYQFYLYMKKQHRIDFDWPGVVTKKPGCSHGPWPSRAIKPNLEPKEDIFEAVWKFMNTQKSANNTFAEFESDTDSSGSFESLHDFKSYYTSKAFKPTPLPFKHPLRQLFRYLGTQVDRRIYSIENDIYGRILLDEDNVFFVHGMPCLQMHIVAPTYHDIERGITLIEARLPRLFANLIITDRLPATKGLTNDGVRAPTELNFTKCCWYQNRVKETSSSVFMREFGMTEKGYWKGHLHPKDTNPKTNDVHFYSHADPKIVERLCCDQARQGLYN